MRTVSAVELRKKFGEIVDQAAAGERIVIERAGHPVAAIVPLSDLDANDPERLKQHRLAVLDDIVRRGKRLPKIAEDPAALIRQMREERTQQILRAVREARSDARE